MGAKYMTRFVNLNMVSDSDSQNASIGRRLGSDSSESAIAKRMLKTTICSTWPSATARATFSGNAWRTTSASVWRGATGPPGSSPSGGTTPTPACVRLMAAIPMTRASVVTTSK